MPQLNKGGKYVFGISVIRPDLTIHIPPQALLEYGATRDGKVIIFTGSKITGGFCITIFVAVKLKVKAYFRGLSCIKGLFAFRGRVYSI